jgi:hypothetical protein
MIETRFNMPPEGEFWPHTWVVAGDLIISLTQEGPIPDEIWNRFVEDVDHDSTRRMLGIGIGAIYVNSKQRRVLVQAMHDKRVAAVLGSSVARGIATALGWMGLKIKAFGWSHMPNAFEYLDTPGLEIDEGVDLVKEMLRRAGAPEFDELAGE